MFVLVRCIPVSFFFSDLLKSWGEECDGMHYNFRATATVDCVHVYWYGHARSLSLVPYHVVRLAGSLGLECCAGAIAHGSVCNSVPRGMDVIHML